jgi:hypothetical protein
MHEAFLSLETVQEGNPSRQVGRDGVSYKGSAKPSTCHSITVIVHTSTVHKCNFIPSQRNLPKQAYGGTLPFRKFGKD